MQLQLKKTEKSEQSKSWRVSKNKQEAEFVYVFMKGPLFFIIATKSDKYVTCQNGKLWFDKPEGPDWVGRV